MNPLVKSIYLLLALAVLTVGQKAYAGGEISASAGAKPAPKAIPLSGKILETMDGGGYTYVLLKNGAEKLWVAVPLMKVTLGQEMSFMPGFEMKNFTSKGLNRKFDRVIFSAGASGNQKVQLSESAIKMVHEGVPKAAAKAEPAKPAAPAQAETSRPAKVQHVAKATGPNAYTIAQLFAKKTKLEKKPVVIRGKVTKVTTRIMKKNWIHIQDGSGSKAKKSDELVVTTKDLPKEGDLVTVRGTLYNNLDFGAGYRYSVLIQDATIK